MTSEKPVPIVLWQKDVWHEGSWMYGRVVWAPVTKRTSTSVIFEVASERDAMDEPRWRTAPPLATFIEDLGRRMLNSAPQIEESKALPPRDYDRIK